MFINNAFAQEAVAAANETSFASFVPLILIFVVFYFLIIRPQSKKMKEHQALVNNLKIGNKVITSGGIHGVVKEISKDKDDVIEVEIADGVVVKMLKNHVLDLVNKEEKSPVKSKK